MIQKADNDRDGLINEEEFYNVMTRKATKWGLYCEIYFMYKDFATIDKKCSLMVLIEKFW
jgi:hypothetical protein